MKLDHDQAVEIKRLFQTAKNIVMYTHTRPDGDAIGSLLGLGLALRDNGKSVSVVLPEGVPDNFSFLPGSLDIQRSASGDFDLVIVLDSSDIKRMGDLLIIKNPPDINIDHHITNEKFARINVVIPEAVSTTEILSKLIPEVGLNINSLVAENLLTGLLTDTIGFRTNNMNPEVLRLAADLIETGLNFPDVYMRSLVQKSFEAIRYWGAGLSRLQRDGAIVWTTMTLNDRILAGYQGRDDADLINVLSTITDSKVNVIFIEQPNGMTKISWRSAKEYDVTKVANRYGGGGHPSAAGAEVFGDIDEVRKQIIKTTKEIIFGENCKDLVVNSK